MQRKLNLLDFGILLIMLFKVQLRLFAEAGMNGAFNTRSPLIEQKQRAFIYKVVNQDNAPLGTSHHATQESVGVPHASRTKQFFGCYCWRQFLDLV